MVAASLSAGGCGARAGVGCPGCDDGPGEPAAEASALPPEPGPLGDEPHSPQPSDLVAPPAPAPDFARPPGREQIPDAVPLEPPAPALEASPLCRPTAELDGSFRAASLRQLERLRGCRVVHGNLTLSTEDLGALAALEQVDGRLRITRATSLAGLQGLLRAGSLEIVRTNLENLAGLERLVTAGARLRIAENRRLRTLLGLNPRVGASRLEVVDNQELTDWGTLAPFRLGSLQLQSNPALVEVPPLGFEAAGEVLVSDSALRTLSLATGLRAADRLVVVDTPLLVDASALSSLSRVGLLRIDGTGLPDLAGLASLEAAEDIIISSNPSLERFAGLERLGALGDLSIERNPALREPPQFPELRELEDLSVSTNATLLAAPALPQLVQVRDLRFRDNAALGEVTSLGALQLAETLELARNAVLSRVELPELAEVSELVRVVCNPALAADQLPWIAREGVNRTDLRGNLGDAPCP